MNTKQLKKQLILNIPYIILGLLATNLGEAWRIAAGANASEKVQSLVLDGVFAMRYTILIDFSLIHQKHRLPMWKEFFYVFFIHFIQVLVHLKSTILRIF